MHSARNRRTRSDPPSRACCAWANPATVCSNAWSTRSVRSRPTRSSRPSPPVRPTHRRRSPASSPPAPRRPEPGVDAAETRAAGTGAAADGTGAVGHGQLSEAIERWAVRAGDTTGGGDLERVARIGGRLVIPGDEEWPVSFDDLGPAAPLGLWVRGAAGLNAV